MDCNLSFSTPARLIWACTHTPCAYRRTIPVNSTTLSFKSHLWPFSSRTHAHITDLSPLCLVSLSPCASENDSTRGLSKINFHLESSGDTFRLISQPAKKRRLHLCDKKKVAWKKIRSLTGSKSHCEQWRTQSEVFVVLSIAHIGFSSAFICSVSLCNGNQHLNRFRKAKNPLNHYSR